MIAHSRRPLTRALWRYRAGWLPEGRLITLLTKRIDALAERLERLECCAELLRRIRDNPWSTQDQTRAEALRRLSWRDYGACAKALLHAERQLYDLEAAVATSRRLAAVRTRWHDAVATHDLSYFDGCSTLRIPSRLDEVAQKLLLRGDIHQAAAVAGILDAYCTSLLDRDEGQLEPAEVSQRIAKVTAHDQRCGSLLADLRNEGLHGLADRLANDLLAGLQGVVNSAAPEPPRLDLAERAYEVAHRILSACHLLEENA